MNQRYCVDANILITAWFRDYPPHIFQPIWDQLAGHKTSIVLIKPIFDEIDPMASSDLKLSIDEKRKKYPLRTWITENKFSATAISDAVKSESLNLEMHYETNDNPKGANQNDITLIAFAKTEGGTVVTFEENQPQIPGKKCNYKIPLICQDQGVECKNFVEMIDLLGIRT